MIPRFLSTPNRLCLLAALWIVATCNASFWGLFHRVQGAHWSFALSLFLALTGLNLLLLRLLTPGRLLKPVLALLLLLAAGASWFMDTYDVAVDSEMLRNALQTNFAEAHAFVGASLAWRLLWQAGLPIVLLWRARLPLEGWWQTARDWLLGIAAGLALVLAAGLPVYSSYASYFRNNEVARYLIAPANAVVGSVTLLRKTLHARLKFEPVGLDARRTTAPEARPLLVVMVVGETARAANFSLGGYARDTNPLLAQRDVLYFRDVTSCGTATAVSVPCMFSGLPRTEFDVSRADRRDSVLDILQRAGVAVRWVDNQSGCKQTCDRVPHEAATVYEPAVCSDGECLDDTLLAALDAQLPGVERDSLLVLHAMGSHGPAYYRRVPPAAATFQPACATARIETCSDAEIVNAYDNSILYTDRILAGLIDRLAAQARRVDSVLLYVSDHGESLGENGLYLHGYPWRIAPELQKKVPMLLWFSAAAPTRLGLDVACLRAKLDAPASHDNIAPTLLGLADVETAVYRPALDLLRGCRSLR